MTTIEFISESFGKSEAIGLLTQVTELRIRQKESQIALSDNEEDIKMKESAIRQLQARLEKAREAIASGGGPVLISSNLVIR